MTRRLSKGRLCGLVLVAVLGLVVLVATLLAPDPPPAPAIFGVYVTWFDGAGDEDRPDIDRFLNCLVYSSTLGMYWGDEA